MAGGEIGDGARAAIEAVWHIEAPKLIGALVRRVRDVGLAEDLAQEALLVALESWRETGIPDNPGAWLMATAKNRAIDHHRRQRMIVEKHEGLGHADRDLDLDRAASDVEAALDDHVGDDLLRLVLIACHPVLSTEARVALTLRLLGGLTTVGIGHDVVDLALFGRPVAVHVGALLVPDLDGPSGPADEKA